MKISIDLERRVIQVAGVYMSLDLLANLAQPDPNVFYRLVRNDDVVNCERLTRSQIVDGI
jgi:hypothetical protein